MKVFVVIANFGDTDNHRVVEIYDTKFKAINSIKSICDSEIYNIITDDFIYFNQKTLEWLSIIEKEVR